MRFIIQTTTLLLHILSAAGEGLRVSNPQRRLDETEASFSFSKPNAKYNFGQSIKIDFVNPSPPEEPYIIPYFAIFSDKGGDLPLNEIPSWDFFLAWLNDCNSQNDCDSTLTEGSVEFSAADPKEAYYYTYDYYGYEYQYGYGYFPFRNGKYVACFIESIYKEDFQEGDSPVDQQLIDCQRFQVKKPKKKMTNKAKVIATRNLRIGEPFEATVKTPVAIANSWVGVYKPENGKAPKGPLDDKTLYWGYTACNTQDGDQTETTNCAKKKKTNKVKIGAKNLNTDKPELVWPQKKGKYFMCVNFHSNKPYDKFVCSKKITVK